MPKYLIHCTEFIVVLCNSFTPPDKSQLGTFFNDVRYSSYPQSRSGDGFNVRMWRIFPVLARHLPSLFNTTQFPGRFIASRDFLCWVYLFFVNSIVQNWSGEKCPSRVSLHTYIISVYTRTCLRGKRLLVPIRCVDAYHFITILVI